MLLLACAPPDPTGPLICEPRTERTVEKHLGDPPRPARTLAGEMFVAVDFDATAEAAGYADCSYQRTYGELLEVTDQGWLCPDCDWVVKGEGVVVSGYEDCYTQISDADAARVEQLGLVGDELWRSGLENVALEPTGATIDLAALSSGAAYAWVDEGELEGGLVTLQVSGTLTGGTSTVEVEDPAGARTDPYACGWPLQSPGGAVEDWSPGVGDVFPNARLVDQCGDEVDLWDFRGRYVVLDASAPDCGPCQLMAEAAEAFKEEMRAQCVEVELITVLSESLRAVNKPASADQLTAWVDTFGLTGPVLADEGFGYGVVAPILSDQGMALPTAVVIDPDGRMIGADSGFAEDEGWARYARFLPAGG